MRLVQSDFDPAIRFSNLLPYIKGVIGLIRSRRQFISPESFKKISQLKNENLPTIDTLSLRDDKVLRLRKYEANTNLWVIAVHGSACFGDHFQDIARYLSAKEIASVLTFDLRGHGAFSSLPGHEVFGPDVLVHDILELVKYLREEKSASRVVLLGHSAGGGLALASALYGKGNPCDGLILLAPYLGLGASSNRPYFGGWLQRLSVVKATVLIFLNLFGIRKFNTASVADFYNPPNSVNAPYVSTWSFHTVLAFGPGLWQTRRKVPENQRVLLVAGTNDECFKAAEYECLIKKIAPQAELIEIPDCGHFDILVDQNVIRVIEKHLTEMTSQTFKLVPFSTPIQSLEMSVVFEVSPEQIQFRFRLVGLPEDVHEMVWPKAVQSPGRSDGLWQTTVFELFLGKPGDSSYLEFNFSPSGEWNAYRFSSERTGMQEVAALRKNPVFKMRKTAGEVIVEGAIDRALLGLDGAVELSATSILDFGTRKEYWAITHKGEKPDFHLRSSFAARLELN